MITIKRVHRPYGLIVDGHAGAPRNEQNHDLVCCAVSTLMQTLLYSASRQGHMIDHDTTEGHMEIRVHEDDTFDRMLAQTFMVVEDGLQMLVDAYPGQIKFVDENAGMRL